MHQLFRRIAIHGTLAAVVLAVIGFMFAELASIWLAGSPAPPPPAGGGIQITVDMDVGNTLRQTVPLRMAIAGFILVVLGETFLHFWRRRKPATPASAASPPPDDAERLLEQLLAESESRAGNRALPGPGTATPEPGVPPHAPRPVPHSQSKV